MHFYPNMALMQVDEGSQEWSDKIQDVDMLQEPISRHSVIGRHLRLGPHFPKGRVHFKLQMDFIFGYGKRALKLYDNLGLIFPIA